MTTPRIEGVGVVTHYSPQGDWAFDTAFHIAGSFNAQLNVYHFMTSPYESPLGVAPSMAPSQEYCPKALVDAERFLREHYEERLGDYLNVGFRLCDNGRHNRELRRCLMRKEWQLLVLPYTEPGANFGGLPIEEFAYRFISPVMLVGPGHASQLHLNASAWLVRDSLMLPDATIDSIDQPSELQMMPVI